MYIARWVTDRILNSVVATRHEIVTTIEINPYLKFGTV